MKCPTCGTRMSGRKPKNAPSDYQQVLKCSSCGTTITLPPSVKPAGVIP